jgi:hypothetical protein
MPRQLNLLAFDLGAESGRAVVGLLEGDRLRLEEVHRFPNGPVRVLGNLHWDVLYPAVRSRRRFHGAGYLGGGLRPAGS